MNIIGMRQEKRAREINQVVASIAKAQEEGKEINFKDVVMATMANVGLSRRTAREYVEVAFFRLGING